MNTFKAVLSAVFTIPIWLYLLYKILVLVNATELMWFLYWTYVPVAVVVAVLHFATAGKETTS